MRAIVESFGRARLSRYALDARPICAAANQQLACKDHSSAARAAYARALGGTASRPGHRVKLSPIFRGDSGSSHMMVALEVDDVVPNMIGVEVYLLRVSADGQSLLRKTLTTTELVVKPTVR